MFYDITINQFTKMLQNLSRILDKAALYAEAKKFDIEVLLTSRLAPDQFNLIRQVQIACDTAKLGASRLTGKEAPVHTDQEKSLPELKKRIEETISYLKTFNEVDFKNSADQKITQPRWEGKWLTGKEFALQHMIPNLFFHVTTAYAILRNNGLDVGKKDYLGEMPYRQ